MTLRSADFESAASASSAIPARRSGSKYLSLKWWPETGLNRRRRPFQGRALPLSYLASVQTSRCNFLRGFQHRRSGWAIQRQLAATTCDSIPTRRVLRQRTRKPSGTLPRLAWSCPSAHGCSTLEGIMRRLVCLLACLVLVPVAILHAQTPVQSQTGESRVVRAYQTALHQGSPALRAFLDQFPKGADLHVHLSGAVYAETFIRDAGENGLCVDPAALSFAN